ncbi:MAG: TIGR02221 family CRISPR-associated protein [Bacteroidales bacterium]|nr:TIGR02221 family CRISPR-associated protein [Bacteroidales bacterium]
MSKVLISFLGTGSFIEGKDREYRKATYKIGDQLYETPFVSAALSNHLHIDKKIIFGTVKSMWEEYYRYFAGNDPSFDEDLYCELGDFSDSAGSSTSDLAIINKLQEKLQDVHIIILKYGLNEEELRENIAKVFHIENLLEKGDELYVDITHGFRSFPVLAQQVIFYLRQISSREIKVQSFYYGMLDVMKELGYAPIVDMKVMLEMNDWLLGASAFRNSADGTMIRDLLKEQNSDMAVRVDNFSKSIRINYAHEIRNQVDQLSKLNLELIDNPQKMILEQVFSDFTSRFKKGMSPSLFQLELAKWYYEKGMYSSSYIILSESIISYLVEKYRGVGKVYEKDTRDEVKTDKKVLSDNRNLFKLYKTVSKVRHNIAHMLEKRHDAYLNDIQNLQSYISKAQRLYSS